MPDEPVSRRDASACAPQDLAQVLAQDSPNETPPDLEELALDLTSEAVRLLAHGADGVWTELGAVPLAADDFRSGIDALRRKAEACGAGLCVTLWLPPDQVLVRRYVLKRGSRDRDEALRRLADDTGHRAGELVIALSPAGDGELVTVLGAFRQTVAEALGYARRWGFRPGRVSTRVEAERFGAAGPAFALPEPVARRAVLRARPALAAAAALLVIGLGSWAAYDLQPVAEPPHAVVASAPEVAGAAVEPEADVGSQAASRIAGTDTRPVEASRSTSPTPPEETVLRAVDPSGAEASGDDAALPPDRSLDLHDVPDLPDARDLPDAPAQLARAADAAPHASERRRSGDRPQPRGPEARVDLDPLQAGIERIRAGEPAGTQGPTGHGTAGEAVAAASDAAPVSVPGRPTPRPARSDPASSDRESPHTAAADGPGLAVAATDEELAWDESVEAEGSDVPPLPAAEMSDSRMAALIAPPPPARPELPTPTARAVTLPAPGAATGAAAAPGRSAAGQRGLALDSTSLIGVIDVNSGREALLRMPSGDFLKVMRGDEVAGWRVNAIGQDAMRLTRGGESRTLLLVTR